MKGGPIQVIPPGLLGFLQLKTSGKNPEFLDDTISPTLDVTDWYFQASLLDFTQAVATAARALANGVTGIQLFSPNSIDVPQQENWWVEEYTIFAAVPAATDTCQFSCMYRTPNVGSTNPYVLGDPSPLLTGVAAAARINVARARQFFAPAGCSLGMFVLANETAATITYNGFVRFARLPR